MLRVNALALGLVLWIAGVLAPCAVAEEEMRFPGDPAEHKIVYQYNEADLGHQEHILNSVSAML